MLKKFTCIFLFSLATNLSTVQADCACKGCLCAHEDHCGCKNDEFCKCTEKCECASQDGQENLNNS